MKAYFIRTYCGAFSSHKVCFLWVYYIKVGVSQDKHYNKFESIGGFVVNSVKIIFHVQAIKSNDISNRS